MSDLDRFLALETVVWQALVDGDAAADERHLSDDFVGIYPSGFATREDHVSQLIDGPSVATYELSDPRLLTVSPDAVMLSYQASFTRPGKSASAETMYVSSLWCQRNNTWVNVFSQDTPCE